MKITYAVLTDEGHSLDDDGLLKWDESWGDPDSATIKRLGLVAPIGTSYYYTTLGKMGELGFELVAVVPRVLRVPQLKLQEAWNEPRALLNQDSHCLRYWNDYIFKRYEPDDEPKKK